MALDLGPLTKLVPSEITVMESESCVYCETIGKLRKLNRTNLGYAVGIVSLWGYFVYQTVALFASDSKYDRYPVYFVILCRDGILRGHRVLDVYVRSDHGSWTGDDAYGLELELEFAAVDPFNENIIRNAFAIEAIRTGRNEVSVTSSKMVHMMRTYITSWEHLGVLPVTKDRLGSSTNFPVGDWERLDDKDCEMMDEASCVYYENGIYEDTCWTMRALMHALGNWAIVGHCARVRRGYSFVLDRFVRFPVYFVVRQTSGALYGQKILSVYSRSNRLRFENGEDRAVGLFVDDPLSSLMRKNAPVVDALFREDTTELVLSSDEFVWLVQWLLQTPPDVA